MASRSKLAAVVMSFLTLTSVLVVPVASEGVAPVNMGNTPSETSVSDRSQPGDTTGQNASAHEKLDPELKRFSEMNRNSTSISSKSGKSTRDRREAIKSYYGVNSFSTVDILVNVSTNREEILENENVSSYAEASNVVSSHPDVRSKINSITKRAGVPRENSKYLLFADAIVVKDARTDRLTEIASSESVYEINDLMTPLSPANSTENSPPNNKNITVTDSSNAGLPSPTDPRVYDGPQSYGTSEKNGIGTRKLTKNGKLTGDGVKIGVFDTGANHSDVNQRIADFQDVSDGTITDNDGQPFDYGQHGTFVSGSIIQSAPESDLYVAATSDYSTSDYVLALEWFLRNEVDIISLSFGATSLASQPGDGSSQLAELTNRAVDGRYGSGLGITDTSASPTIFVSAGNSGEEHVSGELTSSSDSDSYDFDVYTPSDYIILYWDSSQTGITSSGPTATVTAPNGSQLGPAGDLSSFNINVANKEGRVIPIQNAFNYGQGAWTVTVDGGPIEEYHVETVEGANSFHNPDPETTITSPGTAERAITVGAVNQKGVLADFSSRGPLWDGSVKPNLVGPGVSVSSTVPGPSCTSSSPPASCYDAGSGTSYSTPLVAGAAALRSEQYNAVHRSEPSPSEMRSLLVNAGVDPQTGQPTTQVDNNQGAGLLDAPLATRTYSFSGTNTGDEQQISVVTPPTLSPDAPSVRGSLHWDDWNETFSDDFQFEIEDSNGSQSNNTIVASTSSDPNTVYTYNIEGTFGGPLDSNEAWAAATTYPPISGTLDKEGYTSRPIELAPNETAAYAVPVGMEFGTNGPFVNQRGAIRALGYWENANDDINIVIENQSGYPIGYSLVATDDSVEHAASSPPKVGGNKLKYISNSSSSIGIGIQHNYPATPLPSTADVNIIENSAGNASDPGQVEFDMSIQTGNQPYSYTGFGAPNKSHFEIKVGNQVVPSDAITITEKGAGEYNLRFTAPKQPSTGEFNLTVAFSDKKLGVSHTAQTTVENAIGYSGEGSGGSAAVSLIIDASGSMGSGPGSQLRNAKQASEIFVADQLADDEYAAIVAYGVGATNSSKVKQVSNNRTNLNNSIYNVENDVSGFSTNIGDGLILGRQNLDQAPDGTSKAAVILTDGQRNTGPSEDEIINTIAPRYENKGYEIYTISYGAPPSGKQLLRQTANVTSDTDDISTSPDKRFYDEPGSGDISEVYQNIRELVTGASTLQSVSGTVDSGTSSQNSVSIDNSTDSSVISVTINEQSQQTQSGAGSQQTQGGTVTKLYDPNQRLVERNQSTATGTNRSDVEYSTTGNTESYRISDPEPGKWSYEIVNRQTNEISYDASVTGSTSTTLGVATDAQEYTNGSTARLTATLLGSSGGISGATVNASVVRPDGSTTVVPLTEDGLGRYVAEVDLTNNGTYSATITTESGQITRTKRTTWSVVDKSTVLQVEETNEKQRLNASVGGSATIELNVTRPPQTTSSSITSPSSASAMQNSTNKTGGISDFESQAMELATFSQSQIRAANVSEPLRQAALTLKNSRTNSEEDAVIEDAALTSTATSSPGSSVFVSASEFEGPKSASISAGRVSVDPQSYTATTGSRRTVTVTVDIPRGVSSGNYTGNVRFAVNGIIVEQQIKITVTEASAEAQITRIRQASSQWESAGPAGKQYYQTQIADYLTDYYFASNSSSVSNSISEVKLMEATTENEGGV